MKRKIKYLILLSVWAFISISFHSSKWSEDYDGLFLFFGGVICYLVLRRFNALAKRWEKEALKETEEIKKRQRQEKIDIIRKSIKRRCHHPNTFPIASIRIPTSNSRIISASLNFRAASISCPHLEAALTA